MTDLTFDLEDEFLQFYNQCSAATMTSVERMYALWTAVRYVVSNDIPGDIVECGVWRGGSMMLAAKTLLSLQQGDRRLWLYDTYEGMTKPTEEDVQSMTGETAQDVLASQELSEDNPFWALAHLPQVQKNMEETSYPKDNISYVKGKVETTIPETVPPSISILRLDTDWYESTIHELRHLWPLLEPGGVLIVDDYGYWAGARKAVDEYFQQMESPPLLNRIDFTGRIAVKR